MTEPDNIHDEAFDLAIYDEAFDLITHLNSKYGVVITCIEKQEIDGETDRDPLIYTLSYTESGGREMAVTGKHSWNTDEEILRKYEELRAVIDDGNEAMTHEFAIGEVTNMRLENSAMYDELIDKKKELKEARRMVRDLTGVVVKLVK